jgi:transposase
VIRLAGCAMPKACSSDLRERVIEAVEEGASRREAAERFEISPSSAVKWLQSWRREGRRAPKPRGGSSSPLEDYAEEILALLAEQPDWTLDEFIVVMRKRRIPGSRSALWRFLERHGICFKKKPASGRARPGGRGPRATTLDTAAGPA